MKIRPKNNILFAQQGSKTGVKFTSPTHQKEWVSLVFNPYRQHILDQLSKYGEANDYGFWLNEMQARHANLYHSAGNNWENISYENPLVGQYQHDYKGDERFGNIKINSSDKADFNQLGIINAQESGRYDISGPKRFSGDYGNHDYKVDNLYSAITDDRRLLGRKGDWDENSQEFKNFIKDLNDRGWTMYLDKSENGGDDYYKLKRLGTSENDNILNSSQSNTPIIDGGDLEGIDVVASRKDGNQETGHNDRYGINWDKFKSALADPDIIGLGRLYNTIRSNNRIYDHALAAINPDLIDSYHTHRQVVGDEAQKQNYYRQAAAGEAMASKTYTSDAGRQLAYQLEAKNIGDQLRNQGNIIDNAEVRRTSDESNQHQWANTQRDTEVANRNRSAINQAKSLRENLKAQKYAALMTSWDNWLREWQTRLQQKKDRREALQTQLENYDYQALLENDQKLNDLMKDIQKSDYTDQEKIKQYRQRRRELERMILQQRIDRGKSGMKFTYKTKDDLLYKASRDAVEHFRKMSKYASDSYNRRRPKIEKLAPHPKGTRKYQQGGLAPFMIYTPAPIGGERSYQSEITSTSNSGKNSSSGDGANKKNGGQVLDMVKTLFQQLNANGLPVDVNGVYSKISKFLNMSRFMGDELSESDIASMYLQTLYDVTNIRNSYNLFNKTREEVSNNDGLHEFAVTDSGKYIVQVDGKLREASLEEIKQDKSLNPLTNNDVLFLRQYDPEMMLTVGNRYMSAVSNGVGLNKIAQYIKSIAPNIGDTETTIEGYTKQESGLIRQGINLLQNAPKGDYKYQDYFKNADARKAVNAAFNYVKAMLPTNYKAILDINAYNRGVSVNNLIKSLMEIGIDQEYKISIDAVTGKAAKDANGNSKSSNDDIKSNFLDMVQRDQVGTSKPFTMRTKDGTSTLFSLNSKYISQLPNVTEDMSIQKMLTDSKVGQILDSRLGITFGDQIIAPENLGDIMYDQTGGATVVTLPCKVVNGNVVVNFAIKDDYDEALKEASKKVPINYQDPQFMSVLAEELHKKGLDSLLNGNTVDTDMLGHFMVVSAYTTDKVGFDKKSNYIEKVKNPDKALEDRISRALSSDKDKKNYSIDVDDKWRIFEWTSDDVYRGQVFIPLNNDPLSAHMEDTNLKLESAYDLAGQKQSYDKLSKIKEASSTVL